MSRCSHKGETYWNNHLEFYEPDVLPPIHCIQPIMSKHYKKTQWFGRLLFYRHGINMSNQQCQSTEGLYMYRVGQKFVPSILTSNY